MARSSPTQIQVTSVFYSIKYTSKSTLDGTRIIANVCLITAYPLKLWKLFTNMWFQCFHLIMILIQQNGDKILTDCSPIICI